MKLRIRTIAALSFAMPAAAFAQSSVTLYGRIDGGIQYINHVANATRTGTSNLWSAEGGDWGTSMFGLKGVEDLGGGTSTIFDLETAFQVMNGTTGGGRMFSRRAYVGLKNNEWGTLQAGRNLFIDSDGVWEFDPFVQQAFSSASLVRGRNWQQTSNNIEYHSPVWNGFDVQGQFAFGNQTSFNTGPNNDFGRSDGIMLSYHSPLFDVRGIYDELRNSNGKMDNVFTASREYFVGTNVYVQKFKVQAAYTHYSAPDTPTGLADRADHIWLGATYTATPAWAVTAGGFYVRVGSGGGDATHDPSGHAIMYVLGTTYNLSKRTFLYGTVAYMRNSGNSDFSLIATSRDSTSGTNPLTGESQTGAYVGIMHNF
ncbi:porin [Burkholderia plantarii]|uniref:Porin Gram-negative type n=1 Tax=Burkholderia plantarii TaxID=41899 RepID=A0A0B6S4S4_BURPL|nr:porin [Burkholderia plantarii]AJK49364.1 porin Gram-negative type [Burkholderia plantarii]ALK33604.1 Porin, Gram-negative type [Burkholderia plantarii]GLZ16768.1 porin [Burkholderia plantarii]